MPREKKFSLRLTCVIAAALCGGPLFCGSIATGRLLAQEIAAEQSPAKGVAENNSAKAAAANPPAVETAPAVLAALKRLKELKAEIATPEQVSLGKDWKGTLDDVRLLGQLPGLRSLSIGCEFLLDDPFANLKLPRLEKLTLVDISNATLKAATRLPEADTLRCGLVKPTNAGDKISPKCTAVGYRHLASLSAGIKTFDLEWYPWIDSGIDNEALKALCGIKSLEAMTISQGSFTDAGTAPLAGLDKLRHLSITNCDKLDGPGVAALASLPKLEELQLIGIRCNGQGFRALGDLQHLQTLSLSLNGFLDAALKPEDFADLKALKNLKSLRLARWTGVGGLLGSTDFKGDALLADELLAALGQIPTLKSIDIERIATSGEGVEQLASLPLESLTLIPIQLNARALTAIGKLHELRFLTVTDAQTPVRDLTALAQCSGLVHLRLNNCWLEHEALNGLAGLASLDVLDLSHCNFRVDWETALDKLPNLKQLDLTDTNAKDQMIAALPAERLEKLDLAGTNLTGKVFASLAKMHALRELTIDERITNFAALKSLSDLKHLKHVTVLSQRGNLVSSEQIEEDEQLGTALPGKVTVMSGDGD